MKIRDLIHHDAPTPSRRRFSNALQLENVRQHLAPSSWLAPPSGGAPADSFEEPEQAPVTPPPHGRRARALDAEAQLPPSPPPPRRAMPARRAALLNARFVLGMTGQISQADLQRMRDTVRSGDPICREEWVLEHHGRLLAAHFTNGQILAIAQGASHAARLAFISALATLKDLNFSTQQMVLLAILPGASTFLPGLKKHGRTLARRGLGPQAMVELVSQPSARARIERLVATPQA